MSRLTAADDPKLLAEALRRECEATKRDTVGGLLREREARFAAALRGVLDSLDETARTSTLRDMWGAQEARDKALRVAARSWLDAGGELSEEG